MSNFLSRLVDISQAIIIWSRPHASAPAATDGRRIWIDPSLTTAEVRCALTHEAIHVKHGHSSCQSPSTERQVCLETALALIPFTELRRVASWARTPWEMAEELGVTEQVILDRLATLDGDQIQMLWPPSEYIA